VTGVSGRGATRARGNLESVTKSLHCEPLTLPGMIELPARSPAVAKVITGGLAGGVGLAERSQEVVVQLEGHTEWAGVRHVCRAGLDAGVGESRT
jgi:hypothetical protein